MIQKILKPFVVLLVFGVLSTNMLYSQKRQDSHYFALHLTGGYSNFIHSAPETLPTGFLGGGFGLGYEYRKNKFYLQVGLEAMSLNSSTLISNIKHTETVSDTEGQKMQYSYVFTRWTDYQYSAYVNVPLIIGYNNPKGGTYFGVGVKFGMPVFGHSNGVAKYTTIGLYDKYNGQFENVDKHYFTDYKASTSSAINFSPNVAAIMEIGTNVWKSKPKRDKSKPATIFKIGAYAEYGFLNVVNNNYLKPMLDFNSPNASVVQVNSLFNSLTTDALKSVNPLYVGVKATLLFEVIVPRRCTCLQTKKGLNFKNNSIPR